MSFLSSVRHPWKGPRIVSKSSSVAREQPVPERCEAGWPKGHSWAWCAHRGSRDCWHWHTGCTRLPAIPAALKTGVPPGWEVGWDPHEQCSSGVKAPLLQGCCEAWVLPRVQVLGWFQDGILAGRKDMGHVLFFSIAEGLRFTVPHNGFEQILYSGRIKM